MVARPLRTGNRVVVPGVYGRIRLNELRTAMRPDPRTGLGLGDAVRPVALTPPDRYSPTSLGQVERLLAHQPVRVPSWYFGPNGYGDVRQRLELKPWRRDWYLVGPDDTIQPA